MLVSVNVFCMRSNPFNLKADFVPTGDQPAAIAEICRGLREGKRYQTLEGVTGSGKTFTMANVIANGGQPALVISHNKTLAAQLYAELKDFFPDNAVEFFISYYDYYQPEAYIPQTDTFIEKDAAINDEIERLRLSATDALLNRKDVVIVASVSCIYGLGSPEDYKQMVVTLRRGDLLPRDEVLKKLVDIQYVRNDIESSPGTFRVRGDTLEVFPSYRKEGLRIEFFGNEVEAIYRTEPLTGKVQAHLDEITISPAKHFVMPFDKIESAISAIESELAERLLEMEKESKLLEAQRLRMRTNYDIEMLRELGYCSGIENYSRHLAGRAAGERPATLIDYFQGPFLTIIDESHVTVPQIRGMFNGDQARKRTLVEHGFRLPSALDNRPMNLGEFLEITGPVVFTSATPGGFEREHSASIVRQLIRPTGIMDPPVAVRPLANQIDDLMEEIRVRAEKGERTLVTTLTKRTAEDLTDYLRGVGVRVKYLHSEIDAIERVEILRGLRKADFDCLVGINLLREGLDLPEVSLVGVLDADKEGFLRSETALIQTAGRAARHLNGEVILYADKVTDSIRRLIEVTNQRRAVQLAYNREHNITPSAIIKRIQESMRTEEQAKALEQRIVCEGGEDYNVHETVQTLEREMLDAAAALEFERAAMLRDRIAELREETSGRANDTTRRWEERGNKAQQKRKGKRV